MKRSLKIAIVLTATFALMYQMFAGNNPPRFTGVHVTEGNSIVLTFTGAPLTTYQIMATTNLARPFSTIGVLVTDQSGNGSFSDVSTLALNAHRFYRAQSAQ